MATPNPVKIGPVQVGKGCPLALIAGPCVMEPGGMTLRIATRLARLCGDRGIPLVFKASFDKANRTSGVELPRPGPRRGDADVRAHQGRDRPARDHRRP